MLDHLIFNKQKWFNVADGADTVTANGRTYEAVPKQVKINVGTNVSSVRTDGVFANTINDGRTISVSGRAKVKPDQFSAPQVYYISQDPSFGNDMWYTIIPASSCQPKWGGKHPLAHFWRAFRSLLMTKEVA